MIYGDAFHFQIHKGAGTTTNTTEKIKPPYIRPRKNNWLKNKPELINSVTKSMRAERDTNFT